MSLDLASLPVRHPTVYFILAPILALAALSLSPSLTPLVLLLATLRLHIFTIIPRRLWLSGAAQIALISLAVGFVNAGPSLHALSTASTSLVVLACLSVATTSIAVSSIVAGYYTERKLQTGWVHATIFPAVWSTLWAAVEYCSPIGQLTTWSPVVHLGGYAWLREYGGQVAINWVVAAWAVVLADTAGTWIMGPNKDEDETYTTQQNPSLISFADDDLPVHDPASPTAARCTQKFRPTLLLAGLLLALAVPSYLISDIPPPVSAPGVTPFGVACALPYHHKNGVSTGAPSFHDYVAESKKLQSEAKVILWPESAAHFDSVAEREEAFERIRPEIANGTYYGIGFEETVRAESPDGVWKVGMRRNGLILLGWEGVVYEYYKRRLVPVAESFSMTPSNEKPSVFTMHLPHPKSYTAPAWAPGPNFTRPVDITASICLDFSTASSFAGLPSRPALILAPARTWDTSVGLAMWEQAKARAEETGSMMLWCDGGERGVSGVAGRGLHAFRQLGPGSWAQTVSTPWPFDQQRTVFSAMGTLGALSAVWAVMGMQWIASSAVQRADIEQGALRRMVRGAQAMLQHLNRREVPVNNGESTHLLA